MGEVLYDNKLIVGNKTDEEKINMLVKSNIITGNDMKKMFDENQKSNNKLEIHSPEKMSNIDDKKTQKNVSAILYCTQCGKPVNNEYKFCPGCGKEITNN